MKRFSLKKLPLSVLFSVLVSGLFAQTFSEQTGITIPGIANGTALWGDADNDGDVDILISGYDNSNNLLVKLYRNNGSNSYSDAGNIFSPALPAPYGNYTMSVQWVDFDNDGFLDILLNSTTLFDVNNLLVYHHEADHSYLLKSTIEFWAWQGNAAECGDYDNDGDQDILLVTHNSSKIYQNQGNFSFKEQYNIHMDGLLESSGKFVDFDNDGDLDIYLMGSTQASYSPTYRFYENNGDNSFTLNSGVNLQGCFDGSADWGDYNNDGFPDLLLTGKYGNSKIYKNNGNKSFTTLSGITLIAVIESSGKWGDFDNDGDLDIILSGNSNNIYYTKLYTNNGNNTFTELAGSTFEGVYKSSIDLGDYDNDRDLDVLISGDKGGSRVCKVYKNLSSVNNPLPAAPTGLSAAPSGNNIILKWNSVRTDNTPYKAMTYNVMVGTSSGGVNIVSPNSAADGYHRISGMGNGQTDTTFILKNIPKGVTYYWKVQAVDNGWKGSSFSSGPNFTYTASVQASYLNAPVIDGASATLTWSRGNGTNCAVFLKEANTGTAIPSNGTTYTGSSVFKSGSQIGITGWYCVYNGSGTTVNVTNLSAKKDYIFQVFEYTGSAYDLTTATGNPYTFKTGSFTELKSAAFLPVSAVAVNFPTSSFWVDIDNDAGNDLDLILLGANASRIYRNDGAGIFTELASPLGTGYSAACGDYNNDGLIDIALAIYPQVRLFKNTGGGTFAEQSGALPVTGQDGSLDWGDYNNDGYLDILITGSSSVDGRFSKIFKNNGDNTFTEQQSVSLEGLAYGSAKWIDYDNDTFLDLIIAGGTNDASYKTKIYRNTGNNSFTEQTGIAISGTSNSTIDWGDFDNDGDPDLIITGFNLFTPITKIYRNEGNNSFTDLPSTGLPAVNNGSAKWGDYDADGDLDILLTGYTGFYSTHVTKIFRNNGDGTFTEDLSCIFPGVGVSSGNWGDYDKDGDLDIMLTGNTADASILKIYRNDLGLINLSPSAPTGLTSTVTMSDVSLKWKSVRTDNTPYKAMTYNLRVGTAPGAINVMSPNSLSTGFRKIVTSGNMGQDTTFLFKKLPFGVYYCSVQAVDNGFTGSAFSAEGTFTVSPIQDSSLSASTINSNSLFLKWVRGNGDRCVVFAKQSSTGLAVPVNNTGYIADPEIGFGSQIGTSGWYCVYNGRADSAVVTGLIASKQYSFHIIEYMGTFGNEQYFTVTADGNPGVFSTSRFTDQTAITLTAGLYNNVVWGDYDNDSFNDILIPGFPTRIYRNNGDNTFEQKTDITLPSVNYGCAEWGDYDRDGDLDIIITGTSDASLPVTSPVTKIYRNDGNDIFTEQTSISLKQLFYSSVAWGDYDNDGDLDILLNGADGPSPNFTPVSKIYENNGNSTFTEQIQITLTGLYRGSVRWTDYDNDGDLDIAMTGALMETQFNTEGIFKLYRNNGNKTFTEQTLQGVTIESSNSATSWGDFDNDGDLDFMITAKGFMSLYENLGGNSFNNLWGVSLAYQGAAYAAWGDYDNDGFLDIILSNPGLDTKIYRNTHGIDEPGTLTPWFNKQDDDAVKSIGYSFVNWVDYDNDGDLDFLMSKDSGLPTKIFRNNLIMKSGKFDSNTSPAAPSGLKSVNSPTGVVLSWNSLQDDHTPSESMTYNVRIGTSITSFNISPPQSSATGYREIASIGNAQLDTTFLLLNMPAIKYYWSVQAIDQGLKGGAWSPTDSVEVKNVLSFFSADTVCVGLSTQFTNQSVAFGDVIQSYKWLFGDGETSTLENPTHLYNTAGEKNVTLITFSATASDTLTKPILVKAKPLVDFSATVACQGKETTLDNLSSYNELTITSWSWDYGDGKGSTAEEPGTHGYLTAGDYQMKLTAIADNQCSSFITRTVSVVAKPVASISAIGLLSFCNGDSIILNVPYNKNFTYEWKLNNIGQPDSDTSRFTAKLTGEYKVYVLNPLGNCDTTSLPVSVSAKPIPFKPTISSLNYQDGQCPPIETKIKLTLAPEMPGYNYQWFRNGVPYSNGTLSNLEDYLPQGNYSVESSLNGCKSVSDNFILSYATAPEIPKLNARGPSVWYLATQFKSYKYYRWYYNDQLISGANKYIYVANKKLGTYRVEVANENLCYTSSADKIIPTTKSGMSDFSIPSEYFIAGENDQISNVKVYPNPGNGLFYVEFNNEQRGELIISVFRVDGKEILNIKSIKDSDDFRYQINLTGQPKGSYLIKIDLNNISTVYKIIIE